MAAAQIYNMLVAYKGNVTVKIDGIAASAASVIAMAGTTVLMSPVSMMMIHTYTHLGFDDAKDEMVRLEELEAAKKEVEKVSGEKPISQKMFKAI